MVLVVEYGTYVLIQRHDVLDELSETWFIVCIELNLYMDFGYVL